MKRCALFAIILVFISTFSFSVYNRFRIEVETHQIPQHDSSKSSSNNAPSQEPGTSLDFSLSTTLPVVLFGTTSSATDSATWSTRIAQEVSSSSISSSGLNESQQVSGQLDGLTAVCLVGYGRSLKFAGVRQRFRAHVFEPLGTYARLFALIWLDSDKHPLLTTPEEKQLTAKAFRQIVPTKESLAQLEFYKQGLSQDVPKMNDRCEVGWQAQRVSSARRYKVEGANMLQSWLAQWGKLSKCLHMVESYESKQKIKFEFVMRLRPDMLFLQDMGRPSDILGKASVAVPIGIGGKHKFNDHAVLCRRQACPAYFFPVDDYMTCRGRFTDQFRYELNFEDGVQAPAQNRIKLEHWKVEHSRSFVYTLMRDRTRSGNPGCNADCTRLFEKNAHTKFYSECLMLEKTICSTASKAF